MKINHLLTVCMTAAFLCGFGVWSILKPDNAASVSERRPLAQLPEISKDTVMSGEFMADFESYTLDQFPLRDDFRTLKSMTAFYVLRQKDNNDIYIRDGYAAKLEYPMDTDSIRHAADRFRFVYEQFLRDSGSAVYLSVIPDKSYFMAAENGYPSLDYDEFVSELRENTGFAEYIDIFDTLELSDYYRTDSHWRQENITDTARRLADGMGVSLSAEYTKVKVNAPFYGVYFGQSALPLRADEMYYLDSDHLHECTVFDLETNSYVPVYDIEKTTGKDPYEMFLEGPKSLITIEDPAAATDRELICFRDSFGSSIAPLLAGGYRKITLVDIRYISPALLGQFVSFEGQDVLFLYSTSVLNNSITIK